MRTKIVSIIIILYIFMQISFAQKQKVVIEAEGVSSHTKEFLTKWLLEKEPKNLARNFSKNFMISCYSRPSFGITSHKKWLSTFSEQVPAIRRTFVNDQKKLSKIIKPSNFREENMKSSPHINKSLFTLTRLPNSYFDRFENESDGSLNCDNYEKEVQNKNELVGLRNIYAVSFMMKGVIKDEGEKEEFEAFFILLFAKIDKTWKLVAFEIEAQ